jgi:hypothetical protein
MLSSPAVLADDADAHEPGTLEERIHSSHRRQRLDPVHRTRLTRPPYERRRDAGAAVRRVQHHPRQQPQLTVQRRQRRLRARVLQAEVVRAQRQAGGGGAEDADADRLISVPQQDDAACEGKVVAAVMPPSEVRPVGTGAVRQPEIVRE